MEKYENIGKLFSLLDRLLGFIFSIPWWGWVLIVLAPFALSLIIGFFFDYVLGDKAIRERQARGESVFDLNSHDQSIK